MPPPAGSSTVSVAAFSFGLRAFRDFFLPARKQRPVHTRRRAKSGSQSFFLVILFEMNSFRPLMTEETAAKTQQTRSPMEMTHLDVEILSRYVTDTGKILPRKITSLTAVQQRHITRQIKRARNLSLMR